MIHQSYTYDAIPFRIISQLLFVAPKRALKTQMKGTGLNLILLGNLLCIIFLLFFICIFWNVVHKQMLFWIEGYLVVKDCDSVSLH